MSINLLYVKVFIFIMGLRRINVLDIDSPNFESPGYESPVIFTIDADNMITSTDGGWCEFAVNNQGEHLSEAAGDSLWDHIQDLGTKFFYYGLINEIRNKQTRNTSFLYRCDGPDRQRLYRMIIELLPNDVLRFTSLLEGSRENTHAAYDIYMSSEHQIKICQSCFKLFVDDMWVDVSEALTAFEIMKENLYFKFKPSKCTCR
ncbi:MAG: hypothetical protein OQK24_14015 [Magnetovibrio sp.]|nr:hypothetical protein [Magnetovibrio sp.]